MSLSIKNYDLIKRLKINDELAWQQLFRDHYSALCCLAESFLLDRYEAESVVSDVFFHLWEMRETLPADTKLRPYLITCVKNRCKDIMESKLWRENHETDLIDRSSAALSITDSSPLEQLLEKEMEQTVNDAVEALPEDCRRVFKMSRFEDMTREAIASELGISINTVKYHLKQAIANLREKLKFL